MSKQLLQEKKTFKNLFRRAASIFQKKETEERDASSEKSALFSRFLMKKEVKKNIRLIDKADKDYLEQEVQCYRQEMVKVLQQKMSSVEIEELQKLDLTQFLVKVISILKKKRLPQAEAVRCFYFARLMGHSLALKEEMKRSLNSDQYYKVIAGRANAQQAVCHLYVLVEKLIRQVDNQVELMLVNFFNEQKALGEEQLDNEKIDDLLSTIFREIALQLISEIRGWANQTTRLFQPQQSMGKEASGDSKEEEKDFGPVPKLHVDIQIKDVKDMVLKFQGLQKRLEKDELKKRVLVFAEGGDHGNSSSR
jgi:hypothetical protein